MKDMARMIKTVQNRSSSELSRLVLASLPLIEDAEARVPVISFDTSETGFVKGGGLSAGASTVNYYTPVWTDGLPQETCKRLTDCIHAGFDGIVVDMNAALSAAQLYAIPQPEEKAVDLLAQAAQIVRGEKGHRNTVVIARCNSAFLHRLDDSHYKLFMSLVDGVIPEEKNVNKTAYADYGVKIFSDDNFSPTSEEYQTASGDPSGSLSIGANVSR
jgi:hypothetical protein